MVVNCRVFFFGSSNLTALVLAAVLSLCGRQGVHGQCLSPAELAPCSCQPLTGLETGNLAIICVDTVESEVERVFKHINTTDFEDKVTFFYGDSIAFPNNVFASNLFYYLTRLRNIVLRRSGIEVLGPKVFMSYTLYEDVNLAENRLRALPENFLLAAARANFSHNQIREVPPNAFVKFVSVDLSHNRLHWVREKAFHFEGYTNSKVILSENLLSDASFEKDFAPQHSVVLDVNANNLTYFDKDIFENVHKLDAMQNPLECDCRMRWMVIEKFFPLTAVCPDGKEFVQSYLAGKANGIYDCASSLVIDDVLLDRNIFYPCDLAPQNPSYDSRQEAKDWTLSCAQLSYEEIERMISKLSGAFVTKVNISRLAISGMAFERSGSDSGRLGGRFLNFVRFEGISVVSSALKEIDEDAFYASYSSAKDLDFSLNKLRDESGIFSFLSKFKSAQTIRLAGNKLKTVPGGLFTRLRGLKYLDLSDNQLQSVQSGAFFFGHAPSEYRYLQINVAKNKLNKNSFAVDFIERRPTLAIKLILTSNELVCLDRGAFGAFLEVPFERNRVDVDFKSESSDLTNQSDYCSPNEG